MMQVSYRGGSHYTLGENYSLIRELREFRLTPPPSQPSEYCERFPSQRVLSVGPYRSAHLVLRPIHAGNRYSFAMAGRLFLLSRGTRAPVQRLPTRIGCYRRPAVKFILLPCAATMIGPRVFARPICISVSAGLWEREPSFARVIRPCALGSL